ncbi:putative ankyrin repeat domain-containing protein [Phaeoacremonium minimum UCRPA7]|uniref:Putative ankyrin repeat domain-containing protein n=1 Tax=Phaeoacremonium minimum (strain UCR-PA7) TaxID=1286976 RepID=R8B9Z7_PHAM7|nr:putative ankyrin repeat domain-containing protein [Phaeoacremonium minimum UCRPA7]EON96144.1 putative ankyrin repeat domain-containing protein [Phaeoacremonium minimum UCRPA7]
MEKIIAAGMSRAEETRLKFNIGQHEVVVRDQLSNAASFVDWGKDWIGEAVKASPEASLVWAGVCAVLPLLTNAILAKEANETGFTYVTTRMRYYAAIQSLLLPEKRKEEASEAINTEFRKTIIQLYKQIIDYQVQSVLRFFRSKAKTIAREAVKKDDWEKMVEKIKETESAIQQDSQQVNTAMSREELAALAKKAEQIYEAMKQILHVAEEQLKETQKQNEILSEQLGVIKDQRDIGEKLLALAAQREECLQLFRLTDFQWYKDRVENRVEDTCLWFLEHDNYKNWLAASRGPLLVSADPGCGKSVLSKYLVEHELPKRSEATICYFFFKEGDQNSASQVLSSLIHQILTKIPSLVEHASKEVVANGKNITNMLTSLWAILENLVEDPSAGEVIWVLDALDECIHGDLAIIAQMMNEYFNDARSNKSKLKIILTSRPYDDVTFKFEGLAESFPTIRIHGEDEWAVASITREINAVIEYRVDKLAKEKKLSPSIKSHLKKRLHEVPHRTYLWVYLVFDYLTTHLFKKTVKGVDAALDTLPETIEEAYEKMLNRCTEPDQARRALQILLAAYRPLRLSEMKVAVGITPEASSLDDLDLEEDEDFKLRLRDWCGLFVSVFDDKVYFLHQTAREFLIANPLLPTQQPLTWAHTFAIGDTHAYLAGVCMIYLCFEGLDFEKAVSLDPQSKKQPNAVITNRGSKYSVMIHEEIVEKEEQPFLKYALNMWDDHIREYGSTPRDMRDFYSILCDTSNKTCKAWFESRESWAEFGIEDLSPLGIRCLLGHLESVKRAVSKGADVNELPNEDGLSPLYAATVGRHFDVFEYLLSQGADPNCSWCSVLLSQQIILEQANHPWEQRNWENPKYGEKSLQQQIVYDKIPWLERALEHGMDPNPKCKWGFSLLHLATTSQVVKALCDNGADVNAKDYWGVTPLDICSIDEVKDTLLSFGAQHGSAAEAADRTSTGLTELERDIGDLMKSALQHGQWDVYRTLSAY